MLAAEVFTFATHVTLTFPCLFHIPHLFITQLNVHWWYKGHRFNPNLGGLFRGSF